MVRPYAVKWQKKLKKRPRVDDEEEEKDEVLEEEKDEASEEHGEGREDPTAEDEAMAEDAIDQMPGIPIAPAIQNSKKQPGVIFVLERASLEVAKVGKV